MREAWPILENPPVVLAIMEIKFSPRFDIDVQSLIKRDIDIKKLFPTRQNNYHSNINLPEPGAGSSSAQITNQQTGYTYFSEDKKERLLISKESFSITFEGKYPGWNIFKEKCIKSTDFFEHIFHSSIINRISIRFINRIIINGVEDPTEYFNTAISARENTIKYPIESYFFKYMMSIPNTNVKVNVIQSLEELKDNTSSFVFDIDVLDHMSNTYKVIDLSNKLEEIREIKNQVFFDNLTNKTKGIL